MLFLIRVLLITSVIAGIGFGALYALGTLVEPEPREMSAPVAMPRPKG
jgi:hypothetical protein